jgi:hypothetical protein
MSYGCYNKPRPVVGKLYPGWQGYITVFSSDVGRMIRIAVPENIEYVMSTECQYSKTSVDEGCNGCQHNHQEKTCHSGPSISS